MWKWHNKTALDEYHQIVAEFIGVMYNNSDPIANWYEAERVIGFELADEVIKLIGRKDEPDHEPIPEHYYSYLDSASVDEYKRRKAYYIWKFWNKPINSDHSRIEGDYLSGCDQIEKPLTSHPAMKSFSSKIREHLEKMDRHQLTERKAYWNYLKTGSTDSSYNWREADNYVKDLYNERADIPKLIDRSHPVASLLEYCLGLFA